jgi:hypothetical protein
MPLYEGFERTVDARCSKTDFSVGDIMFVDNGYPESVELNQCIYPIQENKK